MIKEIENYKYYRGEEIFSVLNILADLDPQSILSVTNREILIKSLNRNIIYDITSSPLKYFLEKISRMEGKLASYILDNLELIIEKANVKAIFDTLEFASTHNETEKKFSYTDTLNKIRSYTNTLEFITINNILNLLLDAMVTNQTIRSKDQVFHVNRKDDEQVLKILKDLLVKYNNILMRVYHIDINSIDDIKNYKRFLKAPFSEFIDESIPHFTLFMSACFGDTDTLNQLDILDLIDITTIKSGLTPLMIASQNGRIEMVRYLIQRNADLDKECSGRVKKTAFELALENKYEYVAKVLVDYGCKINKKRYLRLAYTFQYYSLIEAMEARYFNELKLNGQNTLTVLLNEIPRIAQFSSFEISQYKDSLSSIQINKFSFITDSHIKLDDIIGVIDTSICQDGKEGLVFTSKGLYINNKETIIYQPYYFMQNIELIGNKIKIININYAIFHEHKIKRDYILNISDKMNVDKLSNMLDLIKENIVSYLK